jgi:hypothetical protein
MLFFHVEAVFLKVAPSWSKKLSACFAVQLVQATARILKLQQS